MAMLPSGYVVSTTGVYTNYPTEKVNGGTALGLTNSTSITTSPMTRIFPVYTAASDGIPNRRNLPVEASGTNHAYNAAKTRSAGTFAYDGSGILIRTVSTTINGAANTALQINGNEQFRDRRRLRQKAWGAKTTTAWRAGYFRWTRNNGSSNPRSAWSTTPTALNENFVLPTNNASNSDDQGQYSTFRSIPGELVYLQGALLPYQDDYKAITG